MEYTLITGASGGIGKELARVFARNHHDLVLVARNAQALNELKTELESTCGVSVLCISQDLTAENAVQALFQELQKENVTVSILVNNAGFGDHSAFLDSDWKRQENMVRLNPYIQDKNNWQAKRNFYSINDDGNTSHGVYATADLLSLNYTTDNNSGTPPPIIRAWEDGKAHDIACDVSAYVDYEITSEKVKEPTLSYRQIFHFLPAKAMADTLALEKYKEPTATSGKKDVFFEEYHYIAPKGKQVYLGTKFAHYKSYHQSDFCYYFYGQRGILKRLGVGGV